MKKLTMPKEIYFEEYDLRVRPYLTLEEVVSIGELVVQADNPIEQEMTIAMNTLICCTELTADDFQMPEVEDAEDEAEDVDVDILDIGEIILSGMWEEVKREIINITMVYDYVKYFESPQIAIAKAKGEAEALKIQADGEAYYNRVVAASLNSLLVQQYAIEKWDGDLPMYNGGGAIPFIDIK